MKTSEGKYKFAYAFGMFPFPKTGKAAYLDGCILGALGLKRQKVNADVICFVTPDINLQDRMKLSVAFDKVIRVPYISPYDMPDDGEESLKTIKMDPKIFDNCNKYTKMHPYTHVFFKLHIFNPELFPYEKVCFVDSDLVPMNYYDSLFMLETPAGWVEYRKKFPYKPWFKQPAGGEVALTDKPQPYVKLFDEENKDLQDPVDIPEAVAMFDENLNYENISISYELFNDVIIWGMVNYPDLHTFFMEGSKVYGSKTSFDKDIFKPLSKEHEFLFFKDIKKGSAIYKRLTQSQKYICNLIQNYDKFVPQIKDKYTSICKTKLVDRYGDYVVNFAMVTYPGVKDIYEKEETMLLEQKRMPFGKFKGKLINDMEENDIKAFMKMKSFKQNPVVRKAFRKTKFKDLMKSESDYKDMMAPTIVKTKRKSKLSSKSKSSSKVFSKSKSQGGALKKKKKSKKTMKKSKKTLYYFYMDGCGWCDKFNPTWSQITKEFKGKLTMKKVNGPNNEQLMKRFGVSSFPTIILVKGKSPETYSGDRSVSDMKRFLK